ncbi:PadR family transcriptional regulator [Plantibacter sp. YIM 135249]|uniref:PadR family transcriptional regulator n=1 Tax=Plantibacter sp. YIM 135249 TaxID=3423918 RepID=UPI003D332657
MVTEIFILSVLRSGPVHGYELKRRVARPLVAPMSNNTLYSALRRLEAEDAVTHVVELQEGKPARKVYTITDRGLELLHERVSVLPATLARDTEEFLVRVSFFGELTPEQRAGVCDARRRVLDTAEAQLRHVIDESAIVPERAWRNLAMRRVLDDVERELGWLDELGGHVDEESPAM